MKKVKWGILGAGGIADRRSLPGMLLAENCEIVAVMDIPAVIDKLAEKYNAKGYTDADSLLADENVEAVYIASPVVFHAEQVRKAIAANKHILVEKPIANTAAESEELCKMAAEKGLLMATGLMMRYNTHHQQMKKLIADGALGQLVSCHAQFTCWYPDMPGNWRQSKATAGGGSMTDMGIHCLDLIEYISGQRIAKVAGMYDTFTFKYDVEDSCTALFRLSESGFGTVDANFNIPDEAAKWRIEFYGTKGHMVAHGTIGQQDGGVAEVMLTGGDKAYNATQDRNENEAVVLEGELGNIYCREFESFADSILNGTKVEVPATDGARIQQVIEKIYKSSETGTFIDII